MPVIQVEGLTKAFRSYKKQPGFKGALKGLFHREYEQILAAKEISFTVEEGEFVGFLGPNGAGKTTTLKMLAGLLYPTGGTARVLGYVPWERRTDTVASLPYCSAKRISFGGICPRANRWS
jgi:ABC-2 type transport system ATP-binding protein